ncbi:STAS domain-containing protein [uncultured Dokdonia sp.]|uniref:STAS domain-containing protein n=1 Tax=uncultured Dokdonia sp. TaxID=575653 RepID=UPI0026303CDB|nr:STAS domain-containing protein [uncultured Dokdonia sp.]
MALQILECDGTFYITGKINATTSNSFTTHFTHVLRKHEEVTINIDNVKEIDRTGVEAFKRLQTTATENQKEFSITGYGCKDIYYEFTYHKAA